MKKCLPTKQRDIGIDILRCITLISIVIAHCGYHDLIFQLRSFDVPLIVLLSAVSFTLSYDKSVSSWYNYFLKRIKRLVFPTWLLLTLYFFIFKCDDIIVVLSSYLLIWGIGYVWIIRIFLVVAILAPLLYKIYNKVTNGFVFWLVAILLLCINEFILYEFIAIIKSDLILYTAAVTLPYIHIYMIGIRIANASKKEILLMSVFWGVIYVIQFIYLYNRTGYVVYTQEYKYPMMMYYYSYAFAVSFLLYAFKDKIAKFVQLISHRLCDSMCWLAQHTLWIYLWHIIFVRIAENIDSFLLRFMIVMISSAICVYIQCAILKFINSHIKSDIVKQNLKLLFEG